MRLPKLLTIFSGLILLLGHLAFADNGLSARADALKDTLGNLRSAFGQRDAAFIRSTSAVFKVIESSAKAAEEVQRAAKNERPRKEVASSIERLRGQMDKMRSFVSYIKLTDRERSILRNVDVRYAQVLQFWNGYGAPNRGPGYLYRPYNW